jgi:hypothetical protein
MMDGLIRRQMAAGYLLRHQDVPKDALALSGPWVTRGPDERVSSHDERAHLASGRLMPHLPIGTPSMWPACLAAARAASLHVRARPCLARG